MAQAGRQALGVAVRLQADPPAVAWAAWGPPAAERTAWLHQAEQAEALTPAWGQAVVPVWVQLLALAALERSAAGQAAVVQAAAAGVAAAVKIAAAAAWPSCYSRPSC